MNTNMFVYAITNKVTGKRYFGVTKNYKLRWKDHRCCIRNPQGESKMYLEMSEAGLDALKFELLAQNLSEHLALELEALLISEYKDNTYNTCPFSRKSIGAANRTARLTEEQAKDIISRREAGELFTSVYADYKHLLKRTGIESIWLGKNWAHLQPPSIFKTHAGRKLTESQVREIRRLVSKGIPQRHLAAKFNISPSAIYNILNGKSYSGVL